jgi:hypothetical protein
MSIAFCLFGSTLDPSTAGALAIVRPETIIRWHRVGFRAYWRWRSRNRVGGPKVSAELRALISEMSRANPLWGAPRIHGELLKLDFEVAQSSASALSHHGLSSAAFTMNIAESNIRYSQRSTCLYLEFQAM